MICDPTLAVQELLVEGQGVPAKKITPAARILHDLGVDGDDAGELFQALHERFGTDFSELNNQWSLFFNAEGRSLGDVIYSMLMIVVCAVASGALAASLHVPGLIWLFFPTFLIGGGRLMSRWFGREFRPVTVEGLAEIVRVGRWPADPNYVR